MLTHAQQDMAVWGPTGSGKTWLLQAFGRGLQQCKDDPHFSYHLISRNLLPLTSSLPQSNNPTQNAEDRYWHFARRPRKNTPAHRESAFTHEIALHDEAGQVLVDAVDQPDQQNLTRLTLQSADAILALLDPTLLQGSPLAVAQLSSTLYSQQEYLKMILALADLLASRDQPGYLALCVSKVDLTGLRRPPEALVEIYFGQQMLELITDNTHPNLSIRAFACSAAGYYSENGYEHANFNSQTGDILYPARWQPYQVTSPFFWLFEANESQRREKHFFGENGYIGYPELPC